MENKDILKWTKENKNHILHELTKDYNTDNNIIPTCIFMAGLPGSGKTEFTKRLIEKSGTQFARVDMDEIATLIQGYTPDKADKFREPAVLIQNSLFSLLIKKKINFIMDGTFRSKYSIQNIKRAYKHGFNIKVIYMIQDPKSAWEYTKAREKIEHRAINFEKFIKTYYEIIENIKMLKELKDIKFSVDLIIKEKNNKISGIYENVDMTYIDRYVNIEYNKDKLIKYIQAND